jgi:hypothetical protein
MGHSSARIGKSVHGKILRSLLSLLIALSAVSSVWADDSGGGIPPTWPSPMPSATVQPLPSDAPAPWGTDPATISGVKVSDTIKGNGFLQETIELQNGNSFFFQSIATTDFSVDSYVKRSTTASNDPEGNLIFNQNLKDPAWGLTDHTFINGFKQPIQMHFDIVERKVAALTSGLNQMDMHFRQMPFLDTATGRIRNRQDIGIWMTSITGIMDEEVSTDQRWTPTATSLFHQIATNTARVRPEKSTRGSIDWWNDLQVVKITDASTNQIVTFSKCNDFSDAGRFDKHFRNNLGTLLGCNSSQTTPIFEVKKDDKSPTPFGDEKFNTFRPGIPNHDLDSFQLTPKNWNRWGGGGAGSITQSGGEGGFGGLITFPDKTPSRSNGD